MYFACHLVVCLQSDEKLSVKALLKGKSVAVAHLACSFAIGIASPLNILHDGLNSATHYLLCSKAGEILARRVSVAHTPIPIGLFALYVKR